MQYDALPEQLSSIVGQALQVMLADVHHELLPIYRRAIYQQLDGVVVGFKTRPKSGPFLRSVRFALDIDTARKILPIWEKEKPDDVWPQSFIKMAEGVSKRTLKPEQACMQTEAAELELLSYMGRASVSDQTRFFGLTSAAMWVCLATLVLGFEACGRFTFDLVLIDEQDTDADLDQESSDLALLAACAYAGAPWDPAADNPEERKEFWEWWLLEAIPKAWLRDHNENC